ncbi:MAG: peptidoglycan DD-metalloendopeptidase family protein [Flavobacteriales bacterium]|nr:peptidoglycan DD-metalloendopeptidase family protein [Flavobacteriales bacterium]MBP6642636.1 peptidoglycan DD-metalloendopeptidase family protein [Flavobacteriales bacterium]MBP7156312.1 peptidoglycan DD-metalloendopeptidase family protein [Flavobacteriales bacterium]HQV73914.1 M23 family metallopeptidase [Flavobacteriales bacterium]HQW39786.1 M23 family metallopeptidase [Flavobacteriales bacterium]
MLDRQAIITRSVLRCLIFGVLYVANSAGFSAIAQSSEVVPALVVYGESKLVEDEEALTDERLSVLLDSLCTLDPAPHSLIRDLRLFQRMRSMGSDQMVLLIDSLFELDTVPYALVNEINLYVDQLPTQAEVDQSRLLAWTHGPDGPAAELYGTWDVSGPNCYGTLPFTGDSTVQLKLIDASLSCGYHVPVPPIVTSRFGYREGRNHNGIDLDLEVWDSVRSTFPGIVRFAAAFGGFGRLVVVRHYNGLETFYAHLHRFKVEVGQEVEAGDVIGLGGSSGHSSGSHLHFEARYKGIPIDPARLIDLTTGNLLCDTLVIKRQRSGYAAYPKGTRFHTVVKGEHLVAIAANYGVPVPAVCYLNGLPERARLRVGQRLMILPTASVEQFVHVVD